MKKVLSKIYFSTYRGRNKLMHRFGLCHLRPNPLLSQRVDLTLSNKTLWSVPSACSWCGSRRNDLVNEEKFRHLQNKTERRRRVTHWLVS